MSALEQFHRAVITALQADAALAGAVGDRIYESAPPDAALPLVAINRYDVEPFDTSDTDHVRIRMQVSAFTSGARARLDAFKIGDLVSSVLHRGETALIMPSYKVAAIGRDNATAFRTDTDPTSPEAHGVFTFTALITPL